MALVRLTLGDLSSRSNCRHRLLVGDPPSNGYFLSVSNCEHCLFGGGPPPNVYLLSVSSCKHCLLGGDPRPNGYFLPVSNCKHRLFGGVAPPNAYLLSVSNANTVLLAMIHLPSLSSWRSSLCGCFEGGTPRRAAETLDMRINMEEILEAAGVGGGERPVDVLRHGFPSYVLRVSTNAFSGNSSVILKACPYSSREPEILLHLHRAGFSVPSILDVRQGEGFRVVIMEDIGTDALYKHRDPEWYMRAVREVAEVHRRFDLSISEAGAPVRTPATRSVAADLAAFLPRYGPDTWGGVVRAGAEGTVQRLKDGTYRGFAPEEVSELVNLLGSLATDTLHMLRDLEDRYDRQEPATGFPAQTLVHGDFHDGNVLIRSDSSREVSPFAIVDWDSARLDSGFFDLVSLYDVADRMKTCRLHPKMMIASYLHARWPDGGRPDVPAAEVEWHRCRMLRAWDELRWFSTTGDDFGDRVRREVAIIRRTLSML